MKVDPLWSRGEAGGSAQGLPSSPLPLSDWEGSEGHCESAPPQNEGLRLPLRGDGSAPGEGIGGEVRTRTRSPGSLQRVRGLGDYPQVFTGMLYRRVRASTPAAERAELRTAPGQERGGVGTTGKQVSAEDQEEFSEDQS